MVGLGEILSVQTPLVAALVQTGWSHVPGEQLDREQEQPFVESDLVAALVRLNPAIADDVARVDELLPQLRAMTLASVNDGLMEANRDFAYWLRGLHDHQYVGTNGHVPVRLVDFENPGNNTLVVSDEVSFGPPGSKARFDIVLWVNGIPLVVGELKTPVSQKVSWMKGASEVVDHYQPGWPAFFVPNAICFATDGRELMYAGIGTPVEHWQTWGATTDTTSLAATLEEAKELLAPRTVLDLLSDFTLYERPDSDDGAVSLRKLVARYTQYEAVSLICDRAKDPTRRKGLIYHTQGSGKTLAMVFAAARLLRDPAMQNPTIVLVADRVQLVSQMWDQFRTTGMPRLTVPRTANDLQRALSVRDQRGLIFTTVHKFASAPLLNQRSNIVVMIDEAHRTQEGDLGLRMRDSLPNATLFAFTGTPIAELDRNTFDTFGDDVDPHRSLHTYSSDQSIADGMTVPIHVSPRKVEFALDRDALDEAFDQLKDEENLTDDEAEVLTRRASRVATFFHNPERVAAVCADIIGHFYTTVDPLGLKAQVVVYDRAACVAYQRELSRLLAERHTQQASDGASESADESVVVMTVSSAKGEDDEWAEYGLTEEQEEAVLRRFRTAGDPLKFLVCTSKLGTGFNAPIEGVMYLDKPLKKHTLFQTITRTNRTWRNPATGQDKRYGIVVDYVGLGDGFARAMSPANAEQKRREIDLDGLIDIFEDEIDAAMLRFAGIDYEHVGAQTLMDAQARIPAKHEPAFAAQFLTLEGIWEACAPHSRLQPHRAAYRFLSQVYASKQPSSGKDELLWHRLGAKTLELVHSHITELTVGRADDVVVADADTIRVLEEEGLIDDAVEVENKTAGDLIDSIAARLKKRLDGTNGSHPVYRSLAERLDQLREKTLAAAEQSIEWLREAFGLAKDLTAAEQSEDSAGTAGLDLLPDPNVGALTQIFNEYAPDNTPEMIGRVVTEIDQIVKEVRYDGWAATQKGDRLVRQEIRNTLRKFQLHKTAGLFEAAYDYIKIHY